MSIIEAFKAINGFYRSDIENIVEEENIIIEKHNLCFETSWPDQVFFGEGSHECN